MTELSSDVNLAIKKKFYELLVELNEITCKKWQLLTNDGLNCLNEISNLFTTLYSTNETDDENKNSTKFNDLQLVNNKFENLYRILDSFKSCVEKLKHIESRLMNILDYDFVKQSNVIDKCFIRNIVKAYTKEFDLKELLVKEHLFKMRHNREELVAITSYWMHEPYLEQTLNSQLKFLIDFFKNSFLN